MANKEDRVRHQLKLRARNETLGEYIGNGRWVIPAPELKEEFITISDRDMIDLGWRLIDYVKHPEYTKEEWESIAYNEWIGDIKYKEVSPGEMDRYQLALDKRDADPAKWAKYQDQIFPIQKWDSMPEDFENMKDAEDGEIADFSKI